jgi:hypothetical protein
VQRPALEKNDIAVMAHRRKADMTAQALADAYDGSVSNDSDNPSFRQAAGFRPC